jgi:hypothetical protein
LFLGYPAVRYTCGVREENSEENVRTSKESKGNCDELKFIEFISNFTKVINRKGVIRTGSIQKKIGNTNLQRELGSGEKYRSEMVCKSGDWDQVPA